MRVYKKLFVVVACVLLLAGVVGWRVERLLETERARSLTDLDQKQVVVLGVVVDDPERRSGSLRTVMEVLSVDGIAREGKIIVSLPRDTQIYFGDRIEVGGTLQVPQSFDTSAGREFDYASYLRVRGISMHMRYATLTSSTNDNSMSLRGWLFSTKHALERAVERVIPEPRAALLEGLLFGERRGMSTELTNAFVVSGLIHVVVLSGYNLAIVGEVVARVFGAVVPRVAALVLSGVTMTLFVLMTGAGAASVRALLMGLVALVARYLRRPAAALRALMFAAVAMLIWNPLFILDPGFVLSVLATFGLVTLAPLVEARLPAFLARAPGIRSVAASTLSVQLYLLPVLLYYTGILSFVALPANLLALPVVPFAMLGGFLSAISALVSPVLALPVALPTDLLLSWVLHVATWSAKLPHASTVVQEFPLWIAICGSVPLTVIAILYYRRNASRSHSS